MVYKTRENTGPAARREKGIHKEASGLSKVGKEKSDTASFSKNTYLNLFTDLENLKKCSARISAREVAWQKKGLQQDVLLDADWLCLALKHISDQEKSRNILQGLESIQGIINKFWLIAD